MKPEHLETMWENGWRGHEQAQMRRLARLSLADKIQWLEDAQALVGHILQARQRAIAAHPPGTASPRLPTTSSTD
jgi:hypothetical protein